jgi:protein-S-isoprenylcysteine O-methyltransferase Ste14
MTVGGGVLSVFGLWLYAASIKRFSSFGQLSGLEEGELVTGGVYRYTRNPQIVGWGLALLGAALAGRSAKAVGLVAVYFLIHRLYFPFEERRLERVFGAEYRHYLARTPRFLGLPG